MGIVYRGFLNRGKIRIFLVDISDCSYEICKKHNLPFGAADALSRVLSVGAAMGVMQKHGRLSIKIDANGPMKGLIVESDCDGNIKGFVYNSDIDMNLPCEKALGNLGIISVIKDFGMERSFTGEVELQSGKIGDDFSYYFNTSEQVPSCVCVGTEIKNQTWYSGALILQLMPGYQEEDELYINNFASQCPHIADILAVKDLEAALKELFPEIELFSTSKIKFNCGCSKERFINGLATLDNKELEDMLKDGSVTLRCHFCNELYELDSNDIQKAIDIRKEKAKSVC